MSETPSRKIHLIGNAHIDPVWLWRWTEGFSEVKATFQSALDRLEDYPGFVFTCAGACYYKWIEENCPPMFERIRQRVAEGRWVPVNGWWIQPDCNIPCGESFARQGLYSQRYYLEKFGILCDTGYNVDSFGHNGMLPQILKKSGMDHYVFMRPMDHEKAGVPNVFQWESADGSRVLTFKIPRGYGATTGEEFDKKLEYTDGLSRAQDTDMMLFYGVGNHGGGPTISLLNHITRRMAEPGGDRLVFSSPSQFMAEAKRRPDPYPVVRGDLQIHAIGCYSAMLEIKQLNRRAEERLLAAERFDTLAHALLKTPVHTKTLAGAWEKVLFSQFHDVLCGCSIRPAYDDARESFGWALTSAAEVLNGALQSISWSVDTSCGEDRPRSKEEDWKLWGRGQAGTPVVVFNPLPFDATLPVEVHTSMAAVTTGDGAGVAMQRVRGPMTNGDSDKWNTLFLAHLPALGYVTYWLHKGEAPASRDHASALLVSEDGRRMENGLVSVTLDSDGLIADLFDRRTGAHAFAGPGANALVIDEEYSDTWGHGLTEYRDVVGAFRMTGLHVVEDGPVRVAVRRTAAYGDSSLIVDYLLYAGSPNLELRLHIHWREKHKMLKLEFPLAAAGDQYTAEIPYGTIDRPMDGTEKPMQRWLDVSHGGAGVSIVGDSTYGADVLDGSVRMTVLRSPIFADHFGVRDELCEFMEQGEHAVRFLVCPHGGSWQDAGTAQTAMAFQTTPPVVYETYHAGPLPQTLRGIGIAPGNIVATALKAAEDGAGFILRCHETAGRATEAELSLPLIGRRWSARFGPHEIKTFLVPAGEDQDVRETDLLER